MQTAGIFTDPRAAIDRQSRRAKKKLAIFSSLIP
jgi:hypothetical protein